MIKKISKITEVVSGYGACVFMIIGGIYFITNSLQGIFHPLFLILGVLLIASGVLSIYALKTNLVGEVIEKEKKKEKNNE
jgi:hypothetical protein